MIQAAFAAATHVQPGGAVTVTVPFPPSFVNVAASGETLKVQLGGTGGVPSCATVIVWSATVAVPVRGESLALAVAVRVTDVPPLPDGGATVSQEALLCAVHAHP